ncbi:mandelate racemase/muconate lactonizing enzyme family protein [uncultured Desulfosarcina sp.]|uniref:mandelate racemase/muconate lactonizing enzyme family protein n=1 Tax=uncultured Desulfosarcina sp. TaxID=218289 RepID=UPI0029C99746|nr:mandelate racemase/muconate lactonizing enzyme family protein [uncultured Desulfosarcina sp.]
MRITNLKVYQIHGAGMHPVLVELNTDDGISGFGEAAVAYGLGAKATAGMLTDIAPLIIGSDARYPRNVWHRVYDNSFWTKGGGAIVFSALSAIDQALWDIKGKAMGVSVSELLGANFTGTVSVYANGWNHNHDDALEWAKAAERPLKDGYTKLKSYPFATKQEGGTLVHVQRRALLDAEFKRACERTRNLRKVVGDGVELMFDLSGGLSSDQLIRFLELCQEVNIVWIEEPLDAFNMSGYKALAGRWNMPIATGERVYTRHAFKTLLDTNGVDVIMPDVGNCGGIWELVQIAGMAEAYNVRVSPHNCASALCTKASIQAWAACSNAMALEIYPYFSDANDYVHVLKNPAEEEISKGELRLTDEPGLGAEVNMENIAPFKSFEYQQAVL